MPGIFVKREEAIGILTEVNFAFGDLRRTRFHANASKMLMMPYLWIPITKVYVKRRKTSGFETDY